jgi:hypothetical protein
MSDRWDKMMSVYKWFSASCPVFVDTILVSLFILLTGLAINLVGWFAIAVFGWHLLTIIGIAVFTVSMVWLAFTHSYYSGGVQEWWKDRPWKDHE